MTYAVWGGVLVVAFAAVAIAVAVVVGGCVSALGVVGGVVRCVVGVIGAPSLTHTKSHFICLLAFGFSGGLLSLRLRAHLVAVVVAAAVLLVAAHIV